MKRFGLLFAAVALAFFTAGVPAASTIDEAGCIHRIRWMVMLL